MKNQMIKFNSNQPSNTLAKLTQMTSRAVDTIIGTVSDCNDRFVLPDRKETASVNQTQLRTSFADTGGRVCYVLDDSGSMSERCDPQTTKLKAVKNACVVAFNALAHSSPNTQVAIISFNSKATVTCPFVNISQGYQQLFASIQNMTAGGNTNISHALETAWQLFDQSFSTPNDRLMLLTDGYGGNAGYIADQIKSKDITISTIGFGENPSRVDEKNLIRIASTENGRPLYEFANNKKKLTKTVVQATQIHSY